MSNPVLKVEVPDDELDQQQRGRHVTQRQSNQTRKGTIERQQRACEATLTVAARPVRNLRKARGSRSEVTRSKSGRSRPEVSRRAHSCIYE